MDSSVSIEMSGCTITYIRHVDGTVHAAVDGEIDLANSTALNDALLAAIEPTTTTDLAIDLSSVDFLDSSGIRTLVVVKGAADRRRIGFVIGAPSRAAAKTLELAGLADYLNVMCEGSDEPTRTPEQK